jgi:hypothetical protein
MSSVVYFPVMKGMGAITPSRFDIKWIAVSGSPSRFHGYFELNEFDDSMTFGPPPPPIPNDPYNKMTTTQNVRAAMIFPVVYWASAEYSITVQLWRNQAGSSVWLGRPIILPGWCTWFANQ